MKLQDDFKTQSFDFVNYVNLTEEESRVIWEGRNHSEVRKWMTDPDPFTWESHLCYIESLKNRTDRSYWAAKKDNVVVGSMCLNPIISTPPRTSENQYVEGTLQAETGMFLLPEFIGQGLGICMKREFIEYILHNTLITTLFLKTQIANIRTIKLNETLGYEKYKEDEAYVYMKLFKK